VEFLPQDVLDLEAASLGLWDLARLGLSFAAAAAAAAAAVVAMLAVELGHEGVWIRRWSG